MPSFDKKQKTKRAGVVVERTLEETAPTAATVSITGTSNETPYTIKGHLRARTTTGGERMGKRGFNYRFRMARTRTGAGCSFHRLRKRTGCYSAVCGLPRMSARFEKRAEKGKGTGRDAPIHASGQPYERRRRPPLHASPRFFVHRCTRLAWRVRTNVGWRCTKL